MVQVIDKHNNTNEGDEIGLVNYFPPVKELLTRADLNMIGLSFSNSHMIQLENAGKFPRRIVLSEQKVAWVKQEIFDWISARKSERK